MSEQQSRWRFTVAHWSDKLIPGQCWFDLVYWALRRDADMDKSRLPLRPVTDGCRRDVQRCGACYCGKIKGAPS